jgi:hypothetical protein
MQRSNATRLYIAPKRAILNGSASLRDETAGSGKRPASPRFVHQPTRNKPINPGLQWANLAHGLHGQLAHDDQVVLFPKRREHERPSSIPILRSIALVYCPGDSDGASTDQEVLFLHARALHRRCHPARCAPTPRPGVGGVVRIAVLRSHAPIAGVADEFPHIETVFPRQGGNLLAQSSPLLITLLDLQSLNAYFELLQFSVGHSFEFSAPRHVIISFRVGIAVAQSRIQEG